jgi:hypothetical protein
MPSRGACKRSRFEWCSRPSCPWPRWHPLFRPLPCPSAALATRDARRSPLRPPELGWFASVGGAMAFSDPESGLTACHRSQPPKTLPEVAKSPALRWDTALGIAATISAFAILLLHTHHQESGTAGRRRRGGTRRGRSHPRILPRSLSPRSGRRPRQRVVTPQAWNGRGFIPLELNMGLTFGGVLAGRPNRVTDHGPFEFQLQVRDLHGGFGVQNYLLAVVAPDGGT